MGIRRYFQTPKPPEWLSENRDVSHKDQKDQYSELAFAEGELRRASEIIV